MFSEWLALSLAYAAGLLVHFVLNKGITFAHRAPLLGVGLMGKYVALVLINYLIAMAVTLIGLRAGAPDWMALMAGIAATTASGFLVSRYWVFA